MPRCGGSRCTSPAVNENELSDLAESNQPDDARQPEARRKTAGSLLDDLAGCRLRRSFLKVSRHDRCTVPWFPRNDASGRSQDCISVFRNGLGLRCYCSVHSIQPAFQHPVLGLPGPNICLIRRRQPQACRTSCVGAILAGRVNAIADVLGAVCRMIIQPSGKFPGSRYRRIPRDRFADAAQEFRSSNLYFLRARRLKAQQMATNEPPDEDGWRRTHVGLPRADRQWDGIAGRNTTGFD